MNYDEQNIENENDIQLVYTDKYFGIDEKIVFEFKLKDIEKKLPSINLKADD